MHQAQPKSRVCAQSARLAWLQTNRSSRVTDVSDLDAADRLVEEAYARLPRFNRVVTVDLGEHEAVSTPNTFRS